MSKKRKGKIVSLTPVQLSAEKYIKTQARTLPIYECLINDDWKDTGLCNIMIARRHKTGNLTFGIYLVDLYCLGLKDSFYEFNMDEHRYQELKPTQVIWEACEYQLAHNIIYGAIAFAEDYGFKPAKEFEISQFILEEDDEDVELIELEFGKDGVPFYVQGPNDNTAKIRHIQATLLATAGEGNFQVLGEDVFDDDDLDEDDEEYWNEDDFEENEEIRDKFPIIFKTTNKIYDAMIRSVESKVAINKSSVGKKYHLNKKGVKDKYNTFDDKDGEDEYDRLREAFLLDEEGRAVDEIEKALKKNPDMAILYNLLQSAYVLTEKFEKAYSIAIEMYERFPDYLFANTNFANILIQNGQYDRVLAVFDNQLDLNYLYPERKTFHIHEAAIFYATMCRYFVGVGDIDSADMYMNAIVKYKLDEETDQTLTLTAMTELCEAKMQAIKDKGIL